MKLHFVLDDKTCDDDAFCMIGWAKAASIRHDVTVHLPALRLWWELRCSIYGLATAELREEYDGVAFVPFGFQPKGSDSFGVRAKVNIGCIVTNLHTYPDRRKDLGYAALACLRVEDAVKACGTEHRECIPWSMDFDVFVSDGNSWHKGRALQCYGPTDRKHEGRLPDIAKRHELLLLDFEADGDLVLAHEGPAFGAIPVVFPPDLDLSPNPSTISVSGHLDEMPRLGQEVAAFYSDRPEQLALRQRAARSYAFAMHSHRKVFDDIDRLLRKVEGR